MDRDAKTRASSCDRRRAIAPAYQVIEADAVAKPTSNFGRTRTP